MEAIRKMEETTSKAQEIGQWLRVKGIPTQSCLSLPPHMKELLNILLFYPTRPTTAGQRRDLYRKLVGGEARDSYDPVDSVSDKYIREFFTLPNANEQISFLYKY